MHEMKLFDGWFSWWHVSNKLSDYCWNLPQGSHIIQIVLNLAHRRR